MVRSARPRAPRRALDRGRRHAPALVFGLLVGLAVAPAVVRMTRPPVPAIAQVPRSPVTMIRPAAADARATAAPTAAAAASRRLSVPADLPDFTHRSARLDDVARRPVELRIRALGVRAAVSSAGIADNGQLDVPAAAGAVVWYGAGSVPGAAGSAVLAGHVDHSGRRGVFYNLSALERDDAIHVALDDGTTRHFVVRDVERHAKDTLPTDELFTRNGSARLTLITCGGAFDHRTGHYADNVVVHAVPEG